MPCTSKLKLIVRISSWQKYFRTWLKPKKLAQRAQKIAQEAKNVAQLEQKDRAVLSKPKLIVYIGRSPKNFFEPVPNPPKKLRRVPKVQKQGPNCVRIKNFHSINHGIQVSFLGFVNAPVMCFPEHIKQFLELTQCKLNNESENMIDIWNDRCSIFRPCIKQVLLLYKNHQNTPVGFLRILIDLGILRRML